MPVRIVQISDCHLFESLDGRLLGMNTQDSLLRVLERVKQDPAYDIALCTGDLVQDASVSGYRRFREMIDALHVPQYWIPGNHDVRANMEAATQNTTILHPVIHIANWQIIMLDSTIEGAVPGLLSDATLAFLDKTLTSGKSLHTLIAMHHQPIPVGAAWLDNLGVQNADAFFKVIEPHVNVRGVIWGHVHQHFDGSYKGLPFLATPSTCIQFTAGSADFAVDDLAPGYRAITLHDDGRIESAVTRVDAFDFQIDHSIKGY